MPQPEFTKRATGYEIKYEWLEAANEYEKALTQQVNAETVEKQAYALYRAAYQSQDNSQFKERIRKAIETYAQACEFYEGQSKAKKLRCDAYTLFLSSILEDEIDSKKVLLNQCLDLGLRSLEACRQARDIDCYVETCNNYLLHLLWRSEYSWDYKEVKSIIEEAYESVAYIFDINEEREDLTSIRQYLSAILLDKPMEVFDSLDIQQELMETSSENAERAYAEANEKQDHYLLGKSALILGYITFEVKGELEASLELVSQALDSAKKTGDNWLIAQANELFGNLTSWHVNTITDDPQTQDTMNQKAFQHTEQAIALYRRISKPISLAYMNHIGYHGHSARNAPTVEKKLKIIRKGITIGYNDLEEAKNTGSELGRLYVLNELLHLMFGLIKYVKIENEKREIIQETEGLIEEIIDVSSRIQPFRIWNISVFKFQAAKLKIARAKLEENPEKKAAFLLEALEVGEECVELSKAHLQSHPSKTLNLDYAVGIRQIGELLTNLYSSTKNPHYLERATNVYNEVLEIYQENELFCRVAEIYWKIATIYDNLGKYVESAQAFDNASASYKRSSEKMSHLEEFYTDYSIYMEAWGEITRAKLHNLEERYEKVNELYTRAAALHASTIRWNYLSNNYEAWAQLAEAEKLSQEGKPIEAKNLFTQVIDTFNESREKLLEIVATIDIHEEKEMAQALIFASDSRLNYCLGRVSLEDARILSKKDEHSASARKYRESGALFQNVLENDLSSPEHNEIIPIITLCKAWEMMELAEAEASPERYESAAKLFMDATDLCYTNRTRLLSLGHSNFCSALYECTKFETSRNMTNLQNANKFLTNATNFYLRAGFDDAMEFSKATQRLYEAYMYMDKAGEETQPNEKARYYIMAERLLGESAQSYQRANHPVKHREVIRLLDYVRRERRLALSLIQVLNAPNISSSTMSFIPPSPTSEYPTGLESFEHGNIQTAIHIKDTDLRSGENLSIVLEMTNTGMSVATLKEVIDLPDEDFAPSSVSGMYKYSDGKIDLRSKRLAPLSSEIVTITMKPRKKGDYIVKPCIEYEDEDGESRICETEQIAVSVEELGLRGWLMGPRRDPSD